MIDLMKLQQLRDIVAMSEEMLDRARLNDWTQVAQLEAGRRALVSQCFQRSTRHQDAPEVAGAIKRILHLNQDISALASIHREAVGKDMHNDKRSLAARAAYLHCAR